MLQILNRHAYFLWTSTAPKWSQAQLKGKNHYKFQLRMFCGFQFHTVWANFRTSLFPTARKEAEGFSILSRCIGLKRGNELTDKDFGITKVASFIFSNINLSLICACRGKLIQAKGQLIQPAMLILSNIFVSNICEADYWSCIIQCN